MTLDPYFHVKDDTYCYPDSNVLRNLLVGRSLNS